jgi:hypothetical protein
MAAWEAISRIRHQLHRMNRRAFRFYPSRATLDGETFFASTDQEGDVAVIHLTRYVAAQHDLFVQLVDSLAMARRATAYLHNQHVQPPSPVVPQPAVATTPISSEPLLGIPVAEGSVRQLNNTPLDYFHLFAAYTSALRAEQRRRDGATPPNTPVSPIGVHPSTNAPSTRPATLDLNEVD